MNLEEIFQAGFQYHRDSEQRAAYLSPLLLARNQGLASPRQVRAKTTKKSRLIHKQEISPRPSWFSPRDELKQILAPSPQPGDPAAMPNLKSSQASMQSFDIRRDFSWRRKGSGADGAPFLSGMGEGHKFALSHREPRLIKNGALLMREGSEEGNPRVQPQTNFIPGRVATANVSPLHSLRARMLTGTGPRKQPLQTSEISFRPRKPEGPLYLRDYESQPSSSSGTPGP